MLLKAALESINEEYYLWIGTHKDKSQIFFSKNTNLEELAKIKAAIKQNGHTLKEIGIEQLDKLEKLMKKNKRKPVIDDSAIIEKPLVTHYQQQQKDTDQENRFLSICKFGGPITKAELGELSIEIKEKGLLECVINENFFVMDGIFRHLVEQGNNSAQILHRLLDNVQNEKPGELGKFKVHILYEENPYLKYIENDSLLVERVANLPSQAKHKTTI